MDIPTVESEKADEVTVRDFAVGTSWSLCFFKVFALQMLVPPGPMPLRRPYVWSYSIEMSSRKVFVQLEKLFFVCRIVSYTASDPTDD